MQVRTVRQQLGNKLCAGIDEMLAVVQQKQQFPVSQTIEERRCWRPTALLDDAQRVPDRFGYTLGTFHSCQLG
ncbi:MAG: hypothetical protein JO352_28600 [Chloroflexi bacterium]|nr:hypothetical protein [Chloroflexota bacterium]